MPGTLIGCRPDGARSRRARPFESIESRDGGGASAVSPFPDGSLAPYPVSTFLPLLCVNNPLPRGGFITSDHLITSYAG